MTKKQTINLLKENGVKANYKNLTVCFPLDKDYVATGYCKKNNEIVAFFIYSDNTVKFEQ